MAKQTPLQTDFEDDEEKPVVLPAVEKDESGVPYCAKHHCRMRQTSAGKAGSPVAYFKCPAEGCDEKGKRVKSTKSVIPSEPCVCQRCARLDSRQVMERDVRLSTAMYTILRCPGCKGTSAPLPRPEFVENHARSRGRAPAEELGSR